jgi:hypothetical protein
MFKSEAALKELYPRLISHSALNFGAKEIMAAFPTNWRPMQTSTGATPDSGRGRSVRAATPRQTT